MGRGKGGGAYRREMVGSCRREHEGDSREEESDGVIYDMIARGGVGREHFSSTSVEGVRDRVAISKAAALAAVLEVSSQEEHIYLIERRLL